jgi:hypothetical protein
MPYKKVPCPDCGQPKSRTAQKCIACNPPTRARTTETRAKMSAAQRGKRHSWSSGSTRPEVAERIRQSWTPEKREAARLRGLAFAADQAWRDMIARSLMGQANPNYQAKDNATPYGPGWGRLHKRLIRERAGNQCERCQKSGPLDIHHKDWTKTNHHPDNLAALCRSCHKIVHPNRQTPDVGPDLQSQISQ